MDNNFIKERIRYYRLKNKYSARNLSLEIGMCSEYINQVETGRLNPSLDFIMNFCDFFKISLSEFFNENNKYPYETEKVASLLNKLPENKIDLVLNLIKELST